VHAPVRGLDVQYRCELCMASFTTLAREGGCRVAGTTLVVVVAEATALFESPTRLGM